MLVEDLHFGATNPRRRCRLNSARHDDHVLTVYSVYQEYLAKTLTDKYGNLSVQMDKIINDANSEIENLHHQMEGQ